MPNPKSKFNNFKFILGVFIIIHIVIFLKFKDLTNQTNPHTKSKQIITYNTTSELDQFMKFISSNSENFKIVTKSNINFTHVGGYQLIKLELAQCVDMLINHQTYSKYNVRVPKGIILEGPPGNGKTLLAKAFAGETGSSFLSVSGSEFVEKYVGVGASRVRELFELAYANTPCIIFIDEIDAIGRARGRDTSSNSERDTTLNELLVQLDGFDTNSGVFVIGATNRIDMLDLALIRPGRIDKKIHIPNPDKETRRSIINIYIKSKPYDPTVNIDWLVESTTGLSGAQIENVINEAMLYALRNSRNKINIIDIEEIINREIGGYQISSHNFTEQTIDKIAIHEMGHAIVGLESPNSYQVSKVVLNWNSPKSPGYTVFDSEFSDIPSKQMLEEQLGILLGGRVAEEIFYNNSVTIGAVNDLERAHDIAKKMITSYGLGSKIIYPTNSDQSRLNLDNEIEAIITKSYSYAYKIIFDSKELIRLCADKLKENKILYPDEIQTLKNKFVLF